MVGFVRDDELENVEAVTVRFCERLQGGGACGVAGTGEDDGVWTLEEDLDETEALNNFSDCIDEDGFDGSNIPRPRLAPETR